MRQWTTFGIIAVLGALLTCGTATRAEERSIGLNFVGANGAPMDASNTAGVDVVRADNWNNLICPKHPSQAVNNYSGSMTAGTVKLSDGTTSALTTVNWAFYGWFGYAGGGINDEKMFSSRIDPFNDTMSLIVSNIPFAKYDVYFYAGDGDGGTNRGGTVTVGGQTRAVLLYAAHPLTYEESTDEVWAGMSTTLGTYVRFTDLISSDLTLGVDTPYRLPPAGLQIVEVLPKATIILIR